MPIGPLNAHDFRLCEDGANLREESDALVSLLAPLCAKAAQAASKNPYPRVGLAAGLDGKVRAVHLERRLPSPPAEAPLIPSPPPGPLSPWEQFKQQCWEEDVKAMSKTPPRHTPNGYWTQLRIIHAIQQYAERYGEPPSAMALNIATARKYHRQDLVDRFYGDADYPHYGTCVKKFGSWNRVIEAAGFEAMRPAQRRHQRRRDPV